MWLFLDPTLQSTCEDFEGCNIWTGKCVVEGCITSVECFPNPNNKKCDVYDQSCGRIGCCVSACSTYAAETAGICHECGGSGAECNWASWRKCDRFTKLVPGTNVTKNRCLDSCFGEDVNYDGNAGLYFVAGQTTPTTCDVPITQDSCNVYDMPKISLSKSQQLNLTFKSEAEKIYIPYTLNGKRLPRDTVWPFDKVENIIRFDRGSKFHWPGDGIPDYCSYRCPDGAALGVWDASYMCTECSDVWGLDCTNRHSVYGDGQAYCDGFSHLLKQNDPYMNWFVNASQYNETIKFTHFDFTFKLDAAASNWSYPSHGKRVCGYGCHPHSGYNMIRQACYECYDDLGCSWCGAEEWGCEKTGIYDYTTCTKKTSCAFDVPSYPHPYLPNSPGFNALAALMLYKIAPDLISNITDKNVTINGTKYTTITAKELKSAERFFNETIRPIYSHEIELWILSNPYFVNTMHAGAAAVNPDRDIGIQWGNGIGEEGRMCVNCGPAITYSRREREFREFVSQNIRNHNSYQFAHPDEYANSVVHELYKLMMMEKRHPNLTSRILESLHLSGRLGYATIERLIKPYGLRYPKYPHESNQFPSPTPPADTTVKDSKPMQILKSRVYEIHMSAKIVDGKYFRNKVNRIELSRSLQGKYHRPLLPHQTDLHVAVVDETFRRRVSHIMSAMPLR